MAAKAVQDIIRTTLGPKSMLKMILDPMGGLTLTNDGNAILREIDVSHPAAKSMIELARTQDEEVGDGTTSVIILASEILQVAQPFLERNMHPTIIVGAFNSALQVALKALEDSSFSVDINDTEQLLNIARSSTGTKFISRFGDTLCILAVQAVQKVMTSRSDGKHDIDIKHFVRVEKIPGGELEDSRVLDGVKLNKDITHPKMRRRIINPRIVLLDCPLEYKKGESQTNVEIGRSEDWEQLLKAEEDYITSICNSILAVKPDLVITEKGVSDLASHIFAKNNVSCLRRVKKTDNNRIARAVGARIINRPDELSESDVGIGCGTFNISKIGDEYFTDLVDCKNPKACTIVLRGGSKDVLNEISRNLDDAMGAVRTLINEPRVVYGGGSAEMTASRAVSEAAKLIEGVEKWPFKAISTALEVIVRTLIENCGAQTIRLLTELRAKHAEGLSTWGVDGNKGVLADIRDTQVYEPLAVKKQTIKTAIEVFSSI